MKKFMRLLFVFCVILQQSNLSAAVKTKATIEKYKQSMAKIKTIVHMQKDAKDKRQILEQVINGVSQRLEKQEISKLKQEEKKTFYKMQKLFDGWKKELAQVKDKDLNEFADTVVQETEQASIAAAIVIIIIMVILIVVLAVICARTGADCRTRYYYPHRCCW